MRDYSPAYQDEYQRLWHEAAARAEAAEAEVARLRDGLRHMMALIVIDEDGAAEAIRMEDWGPVWTECLALLADSAGQKPNSRDRQIQSALDWAEQRRKLAEDGAAGGKDSGGDPGYTRTETTHPRATEADNALKCADITGVGVYVSQASEFAPADQRAEDTVIIVLRGADAVAKGRGVLVAAADLVQDSL